MIREGVRAGGNITRAATCAAVATGNENGYASKPGLLKLRVDSLHVPDNVTILQ
jgi:hypothetical protein